MVRRMSKESNRMNDLVEDLLLLANLDQHRPLRRERVDLGQLLTDAANDAAVLQPERPITLTIDASQSVETVGDTFRLQQVVGAVTANALAYTDRDTELRLAARSTPQGSEITIADNGPGIATHDAALVFNRFYRGDSSRTRRTGGSGLGLAIARSIVHAHHGTITLTTAPGQGCRFDITLPPYEPHLDVATTDNPTADPNAPGNDNHAEHRPPARQGSPTTITPSTHDLDPAI
jgi:two-component system, OmpR family, sensor kinase